MTFSNVQKSFHPGFSTKIKPACRVRVDSDNPLTKGIVSTHVCKNDKYTLGANTIISRAGGFEGYLAGTADGVDTDMLPVSIKSDYSVFVVWHQSDFTTPSGNGFTVYCERPFGGQIFKTCVTKTDGFTFVTRNAASSGLIVLPTGPALDTGRFIHTGCFVKRSDTSRDLYCDNSTKVNISTSSGGTYNYISPTIGYDPQDISASATIQNIYAVYTWGRALNDEEVRALQDDPYQILKPEKEILYFIPAGGATTVPLTGQASTAAQGAPTVTGAASVSLTGQQSTTAQGTITVSITGAVNISLTGQASTAQQGTTTATGAATLTLSGQVSTLGQGTPTATGGALLALTGQEITTVQGTITVSVGGSVTIALSGQAGTVQQGAVSLITANIISVTGQASTARIGNITISEGGLWTIQADDGTTWTLQTNSSDTWTIQ